MDQNSAAAWIEAAATYLATQPEAVHRALATHVQSHRGRCTGCGRLAPPWPCVIALCARRALAILDGTVPGVST
jgi:hypothetical protein